MKNTKHKKFIEKLREPVQRYEAELKRKSKTRSDNVSEKEKAELVSFLEKKMDELFGPIDET